MSQLVIKNHFALVERTQRPIIFTSFELKVLSFASFISIIFYVV